MIQYEFGTGLRYLSVCDGIGAVHLAWQQFGWTCVGVSEIAPFPSAVVDHHWGLRNLGDLTRYREWSERLLADVDVLVGGTPCQSFSFAGKRRSLDDERGNLSLIFINCFHYINEVRRRHGRPPAIAVYENVVGVLNTKDNAFGCLIGGLLGCDEAPETEKGKWRRAGFLSSKTVRVGYRVLDAQYFALAQRRSRVFLVAVPCELVEHLGDRACPSEILSLRESELGKPPTRGAGWQETAGSTGDGPAHRVTAGESELEDLETCSYVAFHHNAQGCQLPSHTRDTSIADTLTASQGAAVAFTKSERARSEIDDETCVPGKVSPMLSCSDKGDTRATTVVVLQDCSFHNKKQNGRGWKADGTSYTLTRTGVQGVLEARASDSRMPQDMHVPTNVDGHIQVIGDEMHSTPHTKVDSGDAVPVGSSEVSGTLAACRGSGFRSNGTPIERVAILRTGVRRLTPRECERLQGFPDNYTLVPFPKNKPAADSPRYKAVGNSMAVTVMWWIGRRIARAFAKDDTTPSSMPTCRGTTQEPSLGPSQSSDVVPAGKATPCRDDRPWPVGADPADGERRQSRTDVMKPGNPERNVKQEVDR